MTSIPDVPVVNYTFLEDGFNQDPYPVLESIRELGRVVYNEAIDRYMVTGYRDCSIVLGQTRMFDAHRSHERLHKLFGGRTMETIDDKEHHDQMRGIWAEDFRRETLEKHHKMIRQSVDTFLTPVVERLRAGETVDVVTDMCRGIPTLVIANFLGIDLDMYEQFASWSDAMGAQLEATLADTERSKRLVEDGTRATKELNAYVASILDERRANPGDDLVSVMVTSPFAQNHMSETEIVASITQLVFAGNETTAGMMAATVATLAEHPDQRRQIVEDPSLIPQAFEEVHRWRTLSQAGSQRFACSPTSKIGDVVIPQEAEIMPLVGAANRDPSRWDRPAEFDIHRERRSHLGFAFGMHSCLGLNLARYEIQIWMERLLAELPSYEIVGDVDYGRGFLARKPARLEIALSA
ncbi:cytochrome P450 [Microbacterium sp. A588]